MRLVAVFAALFSCPALAATWDIVPELSVRETYTDNVALVPDATKQSAWVTQVIPGISITATGARLKFNATYAPEFTYYDYAQGQHDSRVFQRGSATANAEVLEKFLFVDAGAKVDQVNVAPQGPIALANIYTTGNLATVKTLFASPYVRHDFGSAVQAVARYTYSAMNTDNNTALPNSVSDRANLRLQSGPAYRLFTWNLEYAWENIDYEIGPDTAIEVVKADARQLITPTIDLLAQVGYEYYRSGISALPSEGPSWSAGWDWRPSQRTHLTATAGQRFYGNTFFLDFAHATRLTTWGAGYSQNVTTTRTDMFSPSTTSTIGYLDTLFSSRFPDKDARQNEVEQFIARTGIPAGLNTPINFFSPQVLLAKTWQGSAGILGVNNVIIGNVFSRTTEGLSGDQVLPMAPDASIQSGTSLLWNWRMTSRTAWNMIAAYTRIETPSTGKIDNLTNVGMGLTRQFQPRLSGSLSYRHQQNESTAVGAEYKENAAIASIRMRF